MDTLSALTGRVSVARLAEPGPSAEQLELLLKAAQRAPDHGRLRPWRFIVLEGEQRHRLGHILEKRLLREQPDADDRARQRARDKALRAPAVIVALAEIEEEHRIPVWEQTMSTGAAVQNMMVAAHALGLGAMWRTGAAADDTGVKEDLGFSAKDKIVSFLYLGTPAGAIKTVPDEATSTYLRELP